MSLKILKHQCFAAAILWLICVTVAMAQVKTKTAEIPGKTTHEATVERGEVVYVVGDDLIVRMESGEIRHFTVPDDAKAMVDGKEISIRDLRPGMKLERTITTTSADKTVKTVQTGTGTVLNIMAPNNITLRFDDNSVQTFKIPKDQVFTIDGEKKTAFQVRKGMRVTATRIVEEPSTLISQTRRVTGSAPPPPPTPPPPTPQLEGTLLIAEAKPSARTPEPIAAQASEPAAVSQLASKTLPKTGSMIPLIGLLGILFSGTSFAMRFIRRS